MNLKNYLKGSDGVILKALLQNLLSGLEEEQKK
jgi:hypothetical protein